MMSNPDQIRADIEVTRDELGRDVDALADKVSPPKIMERQTARVRHMFGDVKERVMGVAEDVGDTASGAVDAAGEAVRELPHKAKQTAQGAPLIVGLVTAGVGFLVASLIPATETERRWSAALREEAQPLVDKAKDAAQELAEGLKEPAQDAVDQVKESVASSAETVKEEAQSTAERVKGNIAPGSSGDASDDALTRPSVPDDPTGDWSTRTQR